MVRGGSIRKKKKERNITKKMLEKIELFATFPRKREDVININRPINSVHSPNSQGSTPPSSKDLTASSPVLRRCSLPFSLHVHTHTHITHSHTHTPPSAPKTQSVSIENVQRVTPRFRFSSSNDACLCRQCVSAKNHRRRHHRHRRRHRHRHRRHHRHHDHASTLSRASRSRHMLKVYRRAMHAPCPSPRPAKGLPSNVRHVRRSAVLP